jgi:hypothetical protein
MEAEDNRDASQKLLEKFKQTFDTKRADNLTPEGWQSADETIMIFPKGVEKVGFVRPTILVQSGMWERMRLLPIVKRLKLTHSVEMKLHTIFIGRELTKF